MESQKRAFESIFKSIMILEIKKTAYEQLSSNIFVISMTYDSINDTLRSQGKEIK